MKNTGNHIGSRLHTFDRPPNPVNTLLLTGFTIQSLALLYLAATFAKPTPCIQPQFHVGTTGNVYITQPMTSKEAP